MSMDTNKEAPGIDRERIPETITFRTADPDDLRGAGL